jgi:hypothetical protein
MSKGEKNGQTDVPFYLPRNRLRRWVRAQEVALAHLGAVAKKALEDGDRSGCLEALKLQMEKQRDLMVMYGVPVVRELIEKKEERIPVDLSKMSDKEVAALLATNGNQARMGKPKGYPPSGAAKISKEAARARRETEAEKSGDDEA